MDYNELLEKAKKASENSYSPYSNFPVGACVLMESGKTYIGTNVENSSFGATVIDPAYRLTSQITLIDANNQIILWQENYHKLISSRENRIMTQAYSPSSEQLEKVKRYSTKFLSPQVVQETQLALMKIDQYQDLNLRPNIVKPTAVSIDKFKIDGRRASVRSTRYVKAETKKAARNLAKETKALNAKAKANIKEFQNTQAEKQMLKAKEDALPLEDKIKKAQDEQRAKLEAKYEKERIRLEKKQELMRNS